MSSIRGLESSEQELGFSARGLRGGKVGKEELLGLGTASLETSPISFQWPRCANGASLWECEGSKHARQQEALIKQKRSVTRCALVDAQ